MTNISQLKNASFLLPGDPPEAAASLGTAQVGSSYNSLNSALSGVPLQALHPAGLSANCSSSADSDEYCGTPYPITRFKPKLDGDPIDQTQVSLMGALTLIR